METVSCEQEFAQLVTTLSPFCPHMPGQRHLSFEGWRSLGLWKQPIARSGIKQSSVGIQLGALQEGNAPKSLLH